MTDAQVKEIKSDEDYKKALELMESLFDDYQVNEPLIDLLIEAINVWESTSDE